MNLMRETRRCSPQEQACHLYIITMLLVFPLFPGFSGYLNITASKFVFFAAATLLWLLALAVIGLRRHEALPRPGAAGIAALAGIAAVLLSWLCSPNRAEGLLGAGRYDGLLTVLAYFLIFLAVSAYARPRLIYARVFALSVSLCAALALLQLAGLNPLRLFPTNLCYYDSGVAYSGAYLGTIGNTNILDAVLCLALPVFFALFVCCGKYIFLPPLLLSVPVLCKAGGDGAMLALGLCVPVLFPLLLTESVRIRRCLQGCVLVLLTLAAALGWQPSPASPLLFSFSSVSAWLCGAAVLCLAAAFLPLPARVSLQARTLRRCFALFSLALLLGAAVYVLTSRAGSGTVYELRQLLRGQAEDSFGSSRLRIWRGCLALVKERPLLGGGPGTLPLRLNIEFSRYVPETGVTLRSFADNAHNVYLGVLTDAGVLGCAAYFAVILFSASAALRRAADPLYAAFGLGAMCCAIHEFFGLGLFLSAPMFWIILGLLCAQPDNTLQRLEEKS